MRVRRRQHLDGTDGSLLAIQTLVAEEYSRFIAGPSQLMRSVALVGTERRNRSHIKKEQEHELLLFCRFAANKS